MLDNFLEFIPMNMTERLWVGSYYEEDPNFTNFKFSDLNVWSRYMDVKEQVEWTSQCQ